MLPALTLVSLASAQDKTSVKPNVSRQAAQAPAMDFIARRMAPGEHYADLGEVKFWYLLAGHGPLLVVQAPGWGPGSEYLRNGLKHLQSSFTLLFYDPRGSGRSSRPCDAKRMGTQEMVADLEQLRTFLQLESMSLLGHSHGGAIALGYAIAHPERVERLILVDSNVEDYPEAQRRANFAHQMELRHGDKRFTAAIEVVSSSEHYVPKTDEEFSAHLGSMLPLYFYDPVNDLPKFARTVTGPLPSAWVWRTFQDAPEMKQDAELNQIKAKTLLLVGRFDWICPIAVSTHIHEQVPNSQLVVLEKSGHFPWIEAPERFFKEVSRFMQQK